MVHTVPRTQILLKDSLRKSQVSLSVIIPLLIGPFRCISSPCIFTSLGFCLDVDDSLIEDLRRRTLDERILQIPEAICQNSAHNLRQSEKESQSSRGVECLVDVLDDLIAAWRAWD